MSADLIILCIDRSLCILYLRVEGVTRYDGYVYRIYVPVAPQCQTTIDLLYIVARTFP